MVKFLASNILVQQNCSCKSPIMCTCPGNKTCYVLGDMNLLCAEGESTTELWQKLEMKAAGTRGMKSPEVHNLHCYACSSLVIIDPLIIYACIYIYIY